MTLPAREMKAFLEKILALEAKTLPLDIQLPLTLLNAWFNRS